MKPKKVLAVFAGIMLAMLVFVFGSMYVSNQHAAGGGSGAADNSSGGSAQSGNANTNSPGNTGSSTQQPNGSTGNPTGGAQENFIQGAQVQSQPMPTQPISVPRQTSGSSNGTAPNNMQEQSQNNSLNTSQPQVTQNPLEGIQ